MPFSAAQQRQKVPVTIITGFLGAGKTSLLNYLLKGRGTKRIAVVENEFGEVNIDKELVSVWPQCKQLQEVNIDKELVSDNLLAKEDLVSLENGCVCCSLRKDIVKAFATIDQRSCERASKCDSILLETTGLADPAPVAFTFFANPWVASRFKLDSILCVVDARHLMQHLEDFKPEGAINEAVQQIAFSDLILLNKIDLVSDAHKATVIHSIRQINAAAQIVECQLNDPERCPPIDQLLNVNSFSVSKALDVDDTFLDSDSDEESAVPSQPLTSIEADAVQSLTKYKQNRKLQLREAAEKLEAEHEASTTDASTSGREHSHPHSHCKFGLHNHDLKEPCECRKIPDSILQQGERQPKRQHKKLHDLSDISSVAITANGSLDNYRFNMFIRDLLCEKSKDIFRCKGVLSVHGMGDQKFIFQGVHETICYGPADKGWVDGDARVNRIVFIGKGLDRKGLAEGFRSCLWVPLPDGWTEFIDPKSKQPYYVETDTGKKTWTRPDYLCAHVIASHASTRQPERDSGARSASKGVEEEVKDLEQEGHTSKDLEQEGHTSKDLEQEGHTSKGVEHEGHTFEQRESSP